jgi:hypothetical protein
MYYTKEKELESKQVKETVETKAVQSPETLSTMNTIWGIDLAIIILVVFVAVV